MIMKTVIITLVSTLLIAILALRAQESGGGPRMANTPAWSGGYDDRGRGGSMPMTSASGSYGGGGKRGGWGDHDDDDDDDHRGYRKYDDHDGWDGDDD